MTDQIGANRKARTTTEVRFFIGFSEPYFPEGGDPRNFFPRILAEVGCVRLGF